MTKRTNRSYTAEQLHLYRRAKAILSKTETA